MSDLRSVLQEAGEQLEPDPALPSQVRSRVRRRQAITAFATAIALSAAGVASAAGIHALSDRAGRVPTVQVTFPPAPASPSPAACTSGWHLAPNPTVQGDDQDDLVAASAVAFDDIWAVGTRFISGWTGPTAALFEHWDGRAWTVVDGADTNGASVRLNAVAAVSSDDVWAVGEYLPTADETSASASLIEHWNGNAWELVSSPPLGLDEGPNAGRTLDAISALSPTDIWVLGHSFVNTDVTATLIDDVFEHWDGHSWSIVHTSQVGSDKGVGALNDISAASPTDAWTVGGALNGFGEIPDGPAGWGGAHAEHWDGQSWASTPTPSNSSPFTIVAAVSPSDVWAVRGGPFNPYGFAERGWLFFPPIQIMHWDGRTWSVSLQLTARDSAVYPVSMVAVGARDVWVVGTKHDRPLILHWDGKAWRVPMGVDPGGPGRFRWLSSVSVAPDGTVVAFGGAEFRRPDTYPSDPLVNRLWIRCAG
jgi:hypothetical protein